MLYLCTLCACLLLCACNGGGKIGDPVKEHHYDKRDTIASLYPGEENKCETDSLESDSLSEPFDQHFVGPDAPIVED